MENSIILIFQLAILLMSVVIHEFAHGWMAFRLGDSTAKDYGRLTLNPIKHLDFWGSFVIPLMIYVFSGGSAIFGWAKPVPFNPYNLRDQKYGVAKVAVAGPSANLLVALVFGLALRLTPVGFLISSGLAQIFSLIVFLNILLAIFNLVPLPPLDGSKVLFAFLSSKYDRVRVLLEQYGMFFLLMFIFFAFGLIMPLVSLIFRLITGANI
ncbi:MAG: site-2 protease family protein [Parcubacteria group bacterium]|jgi:Zn-dependent protease|nr:site-2 protease family protein [Parcubacteria group bacterium]|tara:strand:+ start:231 stop:860 length:630 start_codon:yes stop_codon:yes gene_type:complete